MPTGMRSGIGAAGTAILGLVSALLLAAGAAQPLRADDRPVIAAASSLAGALPEIVAAFGLQSGVQVRLSFGSSGNILRQLAQGAPYELFMSADEAYANELIRRGLAAGPGAVYARGRLVVFLAQGLSSTARRPKQALAELARPGVARIAVANPEHAPYGRAAREVLERAGVWNEVMPKLVVGESAAQAAQFLATGAVHAGIVSSSLVRAAGLGERGTAVLLPEDWHRPLNQRMVLLTRAGARARAFYAFVLTEPAQQILRRHGFWDPETGS